MGGQMGAPMISNMGGQMGGMPGMMGGMPGMMGNMDGAMCGKGCGKGKACMGDVPPGAQTIMQALGDLPPEAAEDPRGFLLRCALPGSIAGRLGGKDGSSITEVEASTGVRITLPGSDGDATRMLNIE